MEYKDFASEKKIAVLQFSYDTDKEDLIEKYQHKSITLTTTDEQTQDRLKRIVAFFARLQDVPMLPSGNDGLERSYRNPCYKTLLRT
jgi:hypothetical protein